MYLPKDKVLIGTLNTFVGNLAQLIATVVFGVFGSGLISFQSIRMCTGNNQKQHPGLLVVWLGWD